MKALRLRLIGLPGRVVSHARKLIIRLGAGADALATIVNARQTIRALVVPPRAWTRQPCTAPERQAISMPR